MWVTVCVHVFPNDSTSKEKRSRLEPIREETYTERAEWSGKEIQQIQDAVGSSTEVRNWVDLDRFMTK
jgi:hypothetical protein